MPLVIYLVNKWNFHFEWQFIEQKVQNIPYTLQWANKKYIVDVNNDVSSDVTQVLSWKVFPPDIGQ